MNELGLKFVKYFSILLLLVTLNMSCGKVKESVIPDVDFSYSINLTIYNEFNVPGNSIYLPDVGYGGVIIYCELPGSYYAYDATCTHEVKKSCHVGEVKVIGSITAKCPCCESEFILLGGYPVSGPAIESLRPYSVSASGNTLRVYN